MTILNFGSVNIDHVYRVEHLVRPGETIASRDYRQFSGGNAIIIPGYLPVMSRAK